MLARADDELRAEVVDLVFALRGSSIVADYAERLRSELHRCLPWLAGEALAGVHPLGGLSDADVGYYLSGRSRLTLRLPRGRVEQAQALSGQQIDLGEAAEVGRVTVRELWPAKVLYSHFVSFGTADEEVFMAVAQREVEALGFRHARLICGKAQCSAGEGGDVRGFSLMVHGLAPEQSLHLQTSGLGGERQRGCGIFIPHKSVAAVGAEA